MQVELFLIMWPTVFRPCISGAIFSAVPFALFSSFGVASLSASELYNTLCLVSSSLCECHPEYIFENQIYMDPGKGSGLEGSQTKGYDWTSPVGARRPNQTTLGQFAKVLLDLKIQKSSLGLRLECPKSPLVFWFYFQDKKKTKDTDSRRLMIGPSQQLG